MLLSINPFHFILRQSKYKGRKEIAFTTEKKSIKRVEYNSKMIEYSSKHRQEHSRFKFTGKNLYNSVPLLRVLAC